MTRTIWTTKDKGIFKENWNYYKLLFLSEHFGESLWNGDEVEIFEEGQDKPFKTIEVGFDEDDDEVLVACVLHLFRENRETSLKLQDDHFWIEVKDEEKELATYYTLKVNGEEARI